MTVEFLGQLAKEHLTDIAHDIGGRDHNRDACDDSYKPLSAPDAQEDGELRYKTGKERHAHRNQAANDEANGSKRHDLAYPAQLRNLTRMRTVIDHTNDGKEEGRHHTVREHLQARTEQSLPVQG